MELTGRQISKYTVKRRIGQGGMADVYLAIDTNLKREVALKIIRTEMFPPVELDRILKRFRQEALVLAQLDHPNIIRVIDYGEYEGRPYLVMPFLPGGTLKGKLTGPIPWREALKLGLHIVNAVNYAHQNGVLHRDIKPTNILLKLDGSPVITDFGVARILTGTDLTLTIAGVGIGTPNYMAPEQWNGESEFRSDQYALGMLLYQMISGVLPFDAQTPMQVHTKLIQEPLPPLSKFVNDLPEHVENFIKKMLSKDVQKRFTSLKPVIEIMELLLSRYEDKSVPKNEQSTSEMEIQERSELVPDQTIDSKVIVQKANEVVVKDGDNSSNGSRVKKPILKKYLLMAGISFGVLILFSLGWLLFKPKTENRQVTLNADVQTGQIAIAETSIASSASGDKQSTQPTLAVSDVNNMIGGLDPNKFDKAYLGPTPAGAYMRLGKGYIQNEYFSDDGESIVITSTTGVWFYDPTTGNEKNYISTGLTSFSALSPDGKVLAVGLEDGSVQTWDVETGNMLMKLGSHDERVVGIDFSPDSRNLVSCSSDKMIKLWDLEEGSLQKNIDVESPCSVAIIYAPDGSTFASGAVDGQIRIWNSGSGSLESTIAGHNTDKGHYGLTSFVYTTDGRRIVSAAYDDKVKIWDVQSGDLLKTYDNYPNTRSIVNSSNGTYLVRAMDGAIQLLELDSGTLLQTIDSQDSYSIYFSISPDGKTMVSGFEIDPVSIWDLQSGSRIATIVGFSFYLDSIAFAPDGNGFATGVADGSVTLWDLKDGSKIDSIYTDIGFPGHLTFSPNGKYLASGTYAGKFNILRLSTSSIKWRNDDSMGLAFSLAFSPDGRSFAIDNYSGTLSLLDVSSGAVVKEFSEPFQEISFISSVVFAPNGDILASGTNNGIILWDPKKGDVIRTFENESVNTLTFSPDGIYLASGSSDGAVKIWEVATGKLVENFEGHTKGVSAVSYSPDGKIFASGSEDGTVKFWDIDSGRSIKTIADQPTENSDFRPTAPIVFSPDGKLIAQVQNDGSILFWETDVLLQ